MSPQKLQLQTEFHRWIPSRKDILRGERGGEGRERKREKKVREREREKRRQKERKKGKEGERESDGNAGTNEIIPVA